MEDKKCDSEDDSYFMVKSPSKGRIIPQNTSSSQITDLGNGSIEKLQVERREEIEETCGTCNVSISVFNWELESDRLEVSDGNSRFADDGTDKVSTHLESDQVFKLDKLFEATKGKMTESLGTVQEEDFDYQVFQAALKVQHLFRECGWLKIQLLFTDKQSLNWKPLPEFDERVLAKQFESLYGPITLQSRISRGLLKTFWEDLMATTKKSNEKLELVWALKEANGKEAAEKWIDDMLEAAMDRLNLPAGLSGWHLLMKLRKEGESCVYNVNPITNPTHAERFILPRFGTCPGPSNLFVRKEVVESALFEFQIPSNTTIVEGLWPSLLDTTFTHPLCLGEDPTAGKREKNEEEFTEEEKKERKEKAQAFQELHQQLFQTIKTFPLGIELNVFLGKIMKTYEYPEEHLFLPGMSNEDAVKTFGDLFIFEELPERKKKAVILFPAFMEGIFPETKERGAILNILHRVWKKVVFTVRFHGGLMRGKDLPNLFWKLWKVKVSLENWGFRGTEFVQWSMKMWNEDGKQEGLRIKYHEGLKFEGCYDPLLEYVAACEEEVERDES